MAFFSFQLHPRPGSVYVRKPHQPWPGTGTRPDLENQRKELFSRKPRQPAQTTSGQRSHTVAAPTPHELRPRQEHNAVQNSQPLGGCFCLFSSKMTLFRGQTYDCHFLFVPHCPGLVAESGSATHLGMPLTPAGAPKHLTVEGAIPHLPPPLTTNT